MLKINKQLEYIYSIQLLENKIRYINSIYKYLPNIIKKKINKIKKYKNKRIKKKKIYFKYKKKIELLKQKKNKHFNLIKKYNNQKKNVIKLEDLNKLKREKQYSKLKLNFYDDYIKKIIINIDKFENENYNFKKKIRYIKLKINKIKKNLKYIFKIYNKKEKNILYLKNKYIKLIKKYDIYKRFLLIKKQSKDNIGIVTLYGKRAVEGIYLIIPKYKYYKLNNLKKINYDDYSGKILINKRFSKQIKKKINNKLKLLYNK